MKRRTIKRLGHISSALRSQLRQRQTLPLPFKLAVHDAARARFPDFDPARAFRPQSR